MPEPDRKYIENVSRETDFIRSPLEKVYRLVEILETISKGPGIENKFLLKGGTALQLMYTDIRRLSVDIDLNYIGSLNRDEMMEDREKIDIFLHRIFREFHYDLEKQESNHSMEQYIIAYNDVTGNRDRVKVEINFSERIPVLPVVNRRVNHPFDILGDLEFPTFTYNELVAQKTRALITRATPRDLFDVYYLSVDQESIDKDIYRKLTIFYLCLTPQDVRKMNSDLIRGIDQRDIKRFLIPMMKRGDHRIDLDEMKQRCVETVDMILSFSNNEKMFLDRYYDEHQFDQKLLFEDIEIRSDLVDHPVIKWRLSQLKKHTN